MRVEVSLAMTWEVEFTDEFGESGDTLDEDGQESIDSVVMRIERSREVQR